VRARASQIGNGERQEKNYCPIAHAVNLPQFSPSGLSCEYDVPDDVFMVLELDKDILRGRSGRIRYHAAFASV
jgi:hypothetical protein